MNAPESFRADGVTYYDRPAVKSSVWGARVALYTVLGGMAGAAQAIGVLASAILRRPTTIARNANRIGVAIGAGAGPALLIADLHTPNRWYNMLRIFRRTSPMSIGTYVLTTFAGSSLLAAAGVRSAQVPAALAGAGMATYTPALLAATATPLWSSTPRLLAAEFATSAFATGAAVLSLAEHLGGSDDTEALDRIALVSVIAHAAASIAARREHEREGVERPLSEGRWSTMHKAGIALGIALPVACYAMNFGRPNARRSMLAAIGIGVGGFLTRWALIGAGNESARSAREYLRLHGGTQ